MLGEHVLRAFCPCASVPWIGHARAGRMLLPWKSMPRSRRPDPNAKIFGSIVTTLRYRQGWPLLDFGRHTGMSPDFLGLIERGLNVPSLNTILRIAEALRMPAGELVDLVETVRNDIRMGRG